MAHGGPGYPPAGDSLCAPTPASSSKQTMQPIKRARSAEGDDGRRLNQWRGPQTINNRFNAETAHVVNVGRGSITYINDMLGVDACAIMESIDERLKVVHDKKLDQEVNGWLSAPDISQNFNAALRRRQLGTGAWFLDGTQFAGWKEKANTILYIYGAPGCGKTVLCSSIIEAVKHSCKSRLSGWAYFFFDSRNANKGSLLYDNFLRSVLSQLCSRCGGTPGAVQAAYQSHGEGREQPSIRVLEEALREVFDAFDDIYIMVDSLDECGDRIEMLQWIETVAGSWNSARWHLLITSRPEPDITSRLELISNITSIRLRGLGLDKDIRTYVENRLSLISHWSEQIRALVMTTLIGGADGMFRWVAMQIDSLQHCLNARAVIEKLKTLPKDLEETYEQILTSSPHRHDLLHMLHWLAFSAHALRLEEVAEVPSVDFDAVNFPCYDPDLKYSNPRTALIVCSGLVTETDGTVKLAHFTVKEYLMSDRIKTGTAAQFAMSARLSHSFIAQTCAAYLLIFNQPDFSQTSITMTGPFPLHIYAARYLAEHLRLTKNQISPTLQNLLLKLFAPRFGPALVNWMRMYELEDPWSGVDVSHSKPADKVAPPLYYASFLGLQHLTKQLLEDGADVNLHGGVYGTALQAAAFEGHTEIVTMLLGHGANDYLQRGIYGNALQAAAFQGATDIVKIFLEHGTNDNIQGGCYGTALQAAACQGHIQTAKLLFVYGADVNLLGGYYGIALQAAASQGHAQILMSLLERGASVNFQGGIYGAALQAAAHRGHTNILKILLEHGADGNLQGGLYGTALQAAAYQGHTEIVKILIDHGANVDIQGGYHNRTALEAAVAEGHSEIQQLLLEYNAVTDDQASSTRYASSSDHAVW